MAVLSVGLTAAPPHLLAPTTAYAYSSDGDNSGPGNGDDDFDDFDSSGPGDGSDFDADDYDNSGHGNFDDDVDDRDNSGPGSGDDDVAGDDDHSGQGSGHSGFDHTDRDHFGGPQIEDVLYSVEYDSQRGEYVPGEIIFIGTSRDLARIRALGFRSISVRNLRSGGVMARLRLPRGVSIDDAMAQLVAAAPNALATPNTIYRSAQSLGFVPRGGSSRAPALRLRGTMGVIDTGVDASVLPAANALLSQRAFAGPRPVAREHGSMVASIAVARGIRVHVADVFGHSADGALAASAERIAAAIDWMIAHRVAVVNISVEGPNNAVLAEMVRRAAARGHIIVAAAGNGGPAARPTFPAAFDGVLAVTAIDDAGRPYIRANRGSYIDFAAPGVNVDVDVGGSMMRVSGTSFAAPVIAAEAAARLHAPSPAEAARVLTGLQERAEDLGEPGRDHVFGWGALRD